MEKCRRFFNAVLWILRSGEHRSVFLIHNLDDILVSAEDVAYLEKVFDKCATVYPRGGHLGNLWYPENKEHLLDVFKPLLQGSAQPHL